MQWGSHRWRRLRGIWRLEVQNGRGISWSATAHWSPNSSRIWRDWIIESKRNKFTDSHHIKISRASQLRSVGWTSSCSMSWRRQRETPSKPWRTWQRRWSIAVLELGSSCHELTEGRTQAEARDWRSECATSKKEWRCIRRISLARTCGKLSWKSTSRIPTEKWRTWPLQTVEETRFPTKCPRSLWSCPTSFCTLRSTRTSSIRLACACVQSRVVKRLVQTESNPWIRALQRSIGDEFVEPHEDDELDLNALTVKGKGSEDNCFFFFFTAGSTDIALLSGENGIHDEGQGKEHGGYPSQQQLRNTEEASVVMEMRRRGRLGRSGVHSVEDPYTWQRGIGDGVLFGLEMTRSNLRRQWSARALDHERKSIDSWSVDSQASDSEARDEGQCRETSTQCIRNHAPILRCETSSRCVILGVDLEMDSSWHQLNFDGEPRTNEDKTARFQTRVTKKRSPRSR